MNQHRPCPFCGGTSLRLVGASDQDGDPMFPIMCLGCMMIGPPGETKAEAWAQWDKRGDA